MSRLGISLALLLALMLAGCSSQPLAPQVHRDSVPIRPGDPGAVVPGDYGFYANADGSWLRVGKGPDSALIVDDCGDSVRFEVHPQGAYLNGVTYVGPSAYTLSCHYDDRHIFWALMHLESPYGDYKSLALRRQP